MDDVITSIMEKFTMSPPKTSAEWWGRRVRAARALIGMNQHELADAAQLNFKVIGKAEAGKELLHSSAERIEKALSKVGVDLTPDGVVAQAAITKGIED
jgi:ribosome-binding protein aMBF1 (putative translation factor)